jgi:hypothetical protein
LRTAVARIEMTFSSEYRREVRERAEDELDAALDRMGRNLTEEMVGRLRPHESENIETKLLLIAWDRRQHPKRYETLRRAYAARVEDDRPFVPALRAAHATELYRLAWEYTLLHPHLERGLAFHGSTALEALEQLGNDASLVTLSYYFRGTCIGDDENQQFGKRLVGTMRAIRAKPSAPRLRLLLDCVSLYRRQLAAHRVLEKGVEPPEAVIFALTSPKLYGEKAVEWRKVMESYPREMLSEEHRHWVDEALRKPEGRQGYGNLFNSGGMFRRWARWSQLGGAPVGDAAEVRRVVHRQDAVARARGERTVGGEPELLVDCRAPPRRR